MRVASVRPYRQFAWIALVACAAALLYAPFFGNPLVFDDQAFYGAGLARFAATPFDLVPRTFPYFTIASVEVLSGQSLPANRLVSLALHIGCAMLVSVLIARLFRAASSHSPAAEPLWRSSRLLGPLAALVFALHPVAVYGAAYLVQRTILCATLFALLSAILLESGLRQRRFGRIVLAAAAYSLAVMSKEHGIMAALAAATIVMACRARPVGDARWLAAYLVMCLPAAVHVIGYRETLIGQAYEPDIANFLAQLPIQALSWPGGQWLVSAVIQMGLFWEYWAVWLLPLPEWLSIDLRVDFAARWASPWTLLGALAFGAVPLLLFVALRTTDPRVRISVCGVLWFWLLYLTELVSVRFQEPFVLYRSYLWAPGVLLAVTPWLTAASKRVMVTAGCLAAVALVPLAHGRLDTLSSSQALWHDAALKLPSEDVPGAVRVFYNRGLLRARQGDLARALEDFERIVALAPNDFRTLLGRASVRVRLGQFEAALDDLDRALALNSSIGDVHYQRAGALEKLGRPEDAKAAYERAAALDHLFAKFRLQQLARPGADSITVRFER